MIIDEWQKIAERIKVAPTASCVFQEPGLIYRTVRDFLTDDVDRLAFERV
jgi:ribonuclease G